MESKFIIWSYEHVMWWRPERQGYTQNALEAGVYGDDESREIVERALGKETRFGVTEFVQTMLPPQLLLPGSLGDLLLEVRR